MNISALNLNFPLINPVSYNKISFQKNDSQNDTVKISDEARQISKNASLVRDIMYNDTQLDDPRPKREEIRKFTQDKTNVDSFLYLYTNAEDLFVRALRKKGTSRTQAIYNAVSSGSYTIKHQYYYPWNLNQRRNQTDKLMQEYGLPKNIARAIAGKPKLFDNIDSIISIMPGTDKKGIKTKPAKQLSEQYIVSLINRNKTFVNNVERFVELISVDKETNKPATGALRPLNTKEAGYAIEYNLSNKQINAFISYLKEGIDIDEASYEASFYSPKYPAAPSIKSLSEYMKYKKE